MKRNSSGSERRLDKNQILSELNSFKIEIIELEKNIQEVDVTFSTEETFSKFNKLYEALNAQRDNLNTLFNQAKYRDVLIKKTGNLKTKINRQMELLSELNETLNFKLSNAISQYQDNNEHIGSIKNSLTEIKKNLHNSVVDLVLKNQLESLIHLEARLEPLNYDRLLLHKVIDAVETLRTEVKNLKEDNKKLQMQISNLQSEEPQRKEYSSKLFK